MLMLLLVCRSSSGETVLYCSCMFLLNQLFQQHGRATALTYTQLTTAALELALSQAKMTPGAELVSEILPCGDELPDFETMFKSKVPCVVLPGVKLEEKEEAEAKSAVVTTEDTLDAAAMADMLQVELQHALIAGGEQHAAPADVSKVVPSEKENNDPGNATPAEKDDATLVATEQQPPEVPETVVAEKPGAESVPDETQQEADVDQTGQGDDANETAMSEPPCSQGDTADQKEEMTETEPPCSQEDPADQPNEMVESEQPCPQAAPSNEMDTEDADHSNKRKRNISSPKQPGKKKEKDKKEKSKKEKEKDKDKKDAKKRNAVDDSKKQCTLASWRTS